MSADPVREDTHRRSLNQVLGLVVFGLGVVMLALVFIWAYDLYQGIDGSTFGARPQTQPITVPGAPSPRTVAPGTVVATPDQGNPLVATLAALGGRLLALLVLGWLAALLAGRGAALAMQPPRKE